MRAATRKTPERRAAILAKRQAQTPGADWNPNGPNHEMRRRGRSRQDKLDRQTLGRRWIRDACLGGVRRWASIMEQAGV